jgi:hypothetical protein
MKLGKIIEDYKTLLFSNFQKKRICLYFALHGISQTSTPSLCLRKGTWWGFGYEWNGTLEPFP